MLYEEQGHDPKDLDDIMTDINKDGAKKCIGNIAKVLKELLHDIDNDLCSRYKTDIEMVENNIKAIRKILKIE